MAYSVDFRYSARRHAQEGEDVPWKSRLPADFAFLVSKISGRPVQPVFDFLLRKYVKGRKHSRIAGAKNSVEAVTRDLCDFHDFLDAKHMSVEDVDETALEDYLESMVETQAPTTGNPYAPATIVRRKSSVCTFLKDCQDRGLLKHRFTISSVKTPSGNQEIIGDDIPIPNVGPIDRLIRAIDPRVLKVMLDETGPSPVDIDASGAVVLTENCFRTRLMPETCAQTGLRREECCCLSRDAITNADTEGRSPLSSVAIKVVGKGKKERNVPFPVWLLTALKKYVVSVRDPIVSDAIARGWLKKDHGRLFVLETERKTAYGRRVLRGQFGREFKSARDRLAARLARDQGATLLAERVRRTRLTIHALRHSFALTTFIKRRTEGDADAAKYVQSVLGHEYRSTTEDMYLKSSHVFEAELSEAFDLHLMNCINQRLAA